MATDISDLLNKQNNASQEAATESIPANEKLTADEFKRLVAAVQENQKSVKSVKMGSQTYTPDPDGAVTLPYTAEGTEVLLKTTDSTTSLVSITGSIALHLLFTSTTGGYDTGNSGTLYIQTYENGQWVTKGSMPLASKSATASYDAIDITSYLATGSNRVRVYVVDESFGTQSNYIIFDSVVLTALQLEMATDYHLPVTNDYLQFSYYVYGAGVAKTLHLKISGEGGVREIEHDLGTATYTTATYTTPAITDSSTQTVKLLTHGVHTVESWLTCVDGDGNYLESEHITNSIMVVRDASNMTPYLLLQNLKTDVTNYEQTNLFDYAVYNPSGEGMELAFVLTDDSDSTEYLRVEDSVQPQTAYDFVTTVEIENDSDDVVYGYLHVYRKVNETYHDFLLESTGSSIAIINVDNKEKFSPTSGADFFLNPKIRNNSEIAPDRILNAAKDNEELPGAKFENFGFVNDGWVTSNDGQRVLRVLAGQYLTIPYEPFEAFKTNTASSMTLEFDFMVRNITNEVDPIIQICSLVAATGLPLGLYMRPLDGFLFTRSSSIEADQNFSWEEGVRTHIAINIVHALRSSTTSTTTVALVRVFINGVINREFPFELGNANEFITSAGHGGIRIGQEDADIDIYSIRCYKKVLSADECMKDYMSTLPTSTAKIAFRDANDIMENGVISYKKAKEKYNVLVWHGYEPNHTNQSNQKGWLEISQLKPDGTPDNEYSGTIGRKYGLLPCKGQGSTAKTYYWWNPQWDVNKTVDGNGNKIKDDGWVDGNGVDHGMKYQLSADVPAAKKLVLKINYASSMQSHKQGATELYNLLHTAIVGKNSLQQQDPKARVAVIERPFLYFLQTPDDTEPVFHGLGTFGPGKMDKPTWGYDDENPAHADFAMLEGSDNNKPLTDMRVPWDENVTYNVDEEYFEYNGDGCLDFDAGLVYEEDDEEGHVKDQPLDNIIEYYKAAFNWAFMHNPDILPYTDGNLDVFLDDTTVNTVKQYWMTRAGGGAAIYDVYRYDFINKTWVPAGLNVGGIYQTKNLSALYPSALNGLSAGAWDELNSAFIAAIVADAKATIGEYFNVKSLRFHYAFVNHFLAGTDNNSKNTYWVLDPVTHLIEAHQDDLDTIFKTNNSGYQIKPYYIDRMHPYSDDGELLYTEGGGNVLFNLMELMWEHGSTEMAEMMNTVLTTMSDLITAEDQKKGYEKSAWGALEKYFFSIQKYFPAVAYNETARIRYEYPTSLKFVSDRSVKPITQSLGDQLASERQYMKRRLVYMSSYAAYGEFSLTGDNGFGFNTYPRIDGSSPTVVLDVVPHQYLYPTARVGQTLRNPHVRVAPKETYHFVVDDSGALGDTVCGLKGGNYYRSFGNLGDLSVNPTNDFTINGERLVEIVATPTGNPEFRPSRLNINTPLITSLNLNGESLLGGQLDASGSIRLLSMDLRGTKITSVIFPTAKLLSEVRLGGYLTELEVKDLPSLNTLTLDAYTYLTSFVIGDNVGKLDLYNTIAELYDAKHNETDTNRKLRKLEVRDVKWTDVTADFLIWLSNIEDVKITGQITMSSVEYMTFELKKALIVKFGNIDSPDNPLQISYVQRAINSAQIAGDNTFRSAGVRQFTLIPNSPNANNFTALEWSMSASSYASVDPKTGIVTVSKVSETALTVQLTCKITTTDKEIVSTMPLYLYDRPAALGDYVFADGTYSDMNNPLKSVVGICFYLGETDRADGVPDRRMVALEDIKGYNSSTSIPWGLFSGDNTNGITGITFDGISNVYDIATITNFSSSGLKKSTEANSEWYVRDDNYRDPDTGDKYGFVTGLGENTGAGDIGLRDLSASLFDIAGAGINAGEKAPSGLHHTLVIIAHRNQVLDAAGLSIPAAQFNGGVRIKTEMDNLKELISAIIENNGNAAKYQQYYWPAASYCYAYEPEVMKGETLSPKFQAHNWYLPAIGELCRQYWYYRQGLASDLNVFAKAINNGVMSDYTASNRWSSSENYQAHAWSVNFSNGYFSSYGKCNSGVVRAVCAF